MIQGKLFVWTLLSALGAGLVAGIFFAFSSFVMGALGRLPAPQGVAAMQSINVVAVTWPFMLVLFGTVLTSLVAAVLSLRAPGRPGAVYLVVGAALYLVGSIGVTMACNVPQNDALAAVNPASAEAASLWQRYLVSWTAWNHVRTVASLGAMVAFVLALRGGGGPAAQ
jgi:uncharacterized membrane protein